MFVRGGVGAAVVGAAVGAAVVAAALGVGLGVGLGVALGGSVAGAAVRIWTVGLGDRDADGLALGDGELEVPANRDRPPPSSTPMRSSVTRPPATAARIRSIQRGPRRGGGMIFVVSDIGPFEPQVACRADLRSVRMKLLLAATLISAVACGGAPPFSGIECGTADERLYSSYDAGGRDCIWNAYESGRAARWSLRSYTIEGDPIPTTLLFQPAGGIGLVVTRDTSADKFGGVGNQRLFTYRCAMMTKVPRRDDISRYSFMLTNCTGDGPSTSVP